MNKYVTIQFLYAWIVVSLFTFVACNEVDTPVITNPDKPIVVKDELKTEWTLLKEFTFAELKSAGKESGLSWINLLIGNQPFFDGEIQVRAFKVTYLSANPNGSKEKIRLSGVLLLPPAIDSATMHRQVLAPPYTYVLNRQAPTRQLTDYNISQTEAYLIFWMIQASRGYVVMIPDYPGFGDSFGKCFIPYVEKETMAHTTIDFVKASQKVLQENHYAKKNGLFITGYSLGAFVATQVARELETKPTDNLSVDLLFAGGTPCNIKHIADMVRTSEILPEPYLLPLAVCGYKQNSYPDLDVSHILKEPYASNLSVYFDGKQDKHKTFPQKTEDLFTHAFIHNTNKNNTQINAILKANSLTPWNNKCKFILLHGKEDRTVHYDNAKKYAAVHNANGGVIKFVDVKGNHKQAGLPYFVHLMSYLSE